MMTKTRQMVLLMAGSALLAAGQVENTSAQAPAAPPNVERIERLIEPILSDVQKPDALSIDDLRAKPALAAETSEIIQVAINELVKIGKLRLDRDSSGNIRYYGRDSVGE